MVYSHCWVGIFPLVAAYIAGGQLAAAVEASRRLLVPPQQRLAVELESAAWEDGEARLTNDRLAAVVKLGDKSRVCLIQTCRRDAVQQSLQSCHADTQQGRPT